MIGIVSSSSVHVYGALDPLSFCGSADPMSGVQSVVAGSRGHYHVVSNVGLKRWGLGIRMLSGTV